jgi:single-stranded DNA-binding protein
MGKGVLHVNLNGPVTKAELRYTADGKPIFKITVPCTEGYGDNEETIWVDATCFGDTAARLSAIIKVPEGDKARKMRVDITPYKSSLYAYTSEKDNKAHAKFQVLFGDGGCTIVEWGDVQYEKGESNRGESTGSKAKRGSKNEEEDYEF